VVGAANAAAAPTSAAIPATEGTNRFTLNYSALNGTRSTPIRGAGAAIVELRPRGRMLSLATCPGSADGCGA
jgi:hypothetical protein